LKEPTNRSHLMPSSSRAWKCSSTLRFWAPSQQLSLYLILLPCMLRHVHVYVEKTEEEAEETEEEEKKEEEEKEEEEEEERRW